MWESAKPLREQIVWSWPAAADTEDVDDGSVHGKPVSLQHAIRSRGSLGTGSLAGLSPLGRGPASAGSRNLTDRKREAEGKNDLEAVPQQPALLRLRSWRGGSAEGSATRPGREDVPSPFYLSGPEAEH